MITIYGDESSDSKTKRVYAVGALLAAEAEWTSFRRLWAARTGGRVFHSADCESGHGAFRGTEPEERRALHRDLTALLAKSGLIGWAVAVDLSGAREAFPEMLSDQIPGSCFLRTIDFLITKAHADHPGQPIKVVFDRNKKTEYNSRLLHEYIAEEASPENSQLFSPPEFATRDDVGVQAADLWVREVMKFFDGNLFSETYTPREQWKILERTRRFGGDLQFGSYFQSMKVQMSTLEAQTGMGAAAYAKWLTRKRRVDNQSNRIAYMMDVAADDRARA